MDGSDVEYDDGKDRSNKGHTESDLGSIGSDEELGSDLADEEGELELSDMDEEFEQEFDDDDDEEESENELESNADAEDSYEFVKEDGVGVENEKLKDKGK